VLVLLEVAGVEMQIEDDALNPLKPLVFRHDGDIR
jgi:hypothetical protein